MKKGHKLSVFLIKETVPGFIQALKTNFAEYKQYQIKQQVGYEGLIVVGLTRSNISHWRGLLQEGTDSQLDALENSSNRAILFFKIQERIFAITFGYGKHLLNDELIEREFGLRTALNLLDSEKFISIDRANLSDLTLLTRTQSSRKAKPETFNLDAITDLLRGVTGGISTNSDDLGNVITGNEGIYITPKIDFVDIPERLKKLKKAYESEKYKSNFGWIDNLREIKDPGLINTLKENLIKDLRKRDSTKIHIAPPYVVTWEDYEGYAFTAIRDELKTYFDISDFYSYQDEKIDEIQWEAVQSLNIYLKYSNNDDRLRFKFWRFINYETEIGGKVYVFTLGRWYGVDKNYLSDILSYLKEIEESEVSYPKCGKETWEREYNKCLAESSEDLLLFDRDLVRSELYSRSDIEVCDVFSVSKKEFIHVKPKSSSATLSHLFAQGRISSYVLLNDRTFRKNLRSKLSSLGAIRSLIPFEEKDFKSGDYTVTFAVIDSKGKSFIETLPFFSLVNFRITLQGLQNYGFKVKIKVIERES